MRALVFFIWLLPSVSFGFGVTDRAGFFTQETVEVAQDHLAKLYSRYNEDVTIDTYDKPMKPITGDRSKFFSNLAINGAPNKGVYIMIHRTPGHLEVVSTSKHVSAGDRAEIALALTNAFKSKNFDGGLVNAIATIEVAYTGQNAPAPKVATVAAAPSAPVEHTSSGTSLWWYFGVILIAGALFLFIRKLFSVGERTTTTFAKPWTPGNVTTDTPTSSYQPPSYPVQRDTTIIVGGGGGASAGDTMLAAGVGSFAGTMLAESLSEDGRRRRRVESAAADFDAAPASAHPYARPSSDPVSPASSGGDFDSGSSGGDTDDDKDKSSGDFDSGSSSGDSDSSSSDSSSGDDF